MERVLNYIEFDDSLRTGNERVDEQHEMLIGMFNELHTASCANCGQDVVEPILERLQAYTIQHFADEQKLMVESRYPADVMVKHFEEHSRLSSRVRDMIVEYRKNGLATILPLATLLQEWIATHIRQQDRLVAEHVRQYQTRGASG